MLNKKTQIVIGIAVLILSVAFLLVGVYFANLQGVIFQNGSNSLQLFANNMGAIVNSLYSAPSHMSISLSGNSSVCTWQPSIGAYTCNGGSKIYNLSYATGPTLDSGKTMFSVALCILVGTGPPGDRTAEEATTAAADTADEAVSATEQAASEEAGTVLYTNSFEYTTAAGDVISGAYMANPNLKTIIVELGSGMSDSNILEATDYVQSGLAEVNPTFSNAKIGVVLSESTQTQLAVSREVSSFVSETGVLEDEAALPEIESVAPTSISQITDSGYTSTSKGLGTLSFLKKAGISLLVNYGVPLTAYWLASNEHTIASDLSVFSNPAGSSIANSLSGLQTLGPIPSNLLSTSDYAVRYFQSLTLANTLSSLPPGDSKQIAVSTASNELALEKNALTELANYGASQSPSNPYSTPVGGESVPGELTSPNSFVGPAYFGPALGVTATADPILSSIFADSQTAFLVYGRTASCLGTLPEAFSASNYNSFSSDFSNGASIVGALTTFFMAYGKLNTVFPLGTYFVGYGGEIYLNGESNGRPTMASAPVISDMSDLCSMAQSSTIPGRPLKSLLNPLKDGEINFSINQGLYNTMCSPNSKLYPKSLSSFVDRILTSKSKRNVSILMPPQYALVFSNSSGDNDICLSNVVLSSSGVPISLQTKIDGSNYLTEYGLPYTCFNISEISAGKYNIDFNTTMNQHSSSAFSIPSEIGKNAFFMINQNNVGFSIPPYAYDNSNFISGGPPSFTILGGVSSPMITALSAGLAPKLQVGLTISLNSLMEKLDNNILAAPNLSFYPTDYANITFEVSPSIASNGNENLTLKFVSNKIVFGVYPNSNSSLGGPFNESSVAQW